MCALFIFAEEILFSIFHVQYWLQYSKSSSPHSVTTFIVWQKWLGENSPFLLHFLMHIHVLMLCRKFELIPIKFGFFLQIFKVAPKFSKSLYYSTGSLAKFHKK